MDLRTIFVIAACLSCLLPPAESILLELGGAAIKGALVKGALVKGALIKGALVAKGLAVGAAAKGAALLAKGAAVKGAALVAPKGAALKGAAVHHALHKPLVAPLAYPRVYVQKTVAVPVPRVTGLWDLLQSALRAKTAAVSGVLQHKVANAPTLTVYKSYTPVPY